jgi:hypothetical protein
MRASRSMTRVARKHNLFFARALQRIDPMSRIATSTTEAGSVWSWIWR